MASSITHSYFILDVYEKLDIKTKEFLLDQKEMLKTSAQGMDPLFFYNITKFKKGERIRDFGLYFHDNNTYQFFETLINYIKLNGYANNKQVMAYLYGMLSHYVLDSNIHPLVVYKTGNYDIMKHPEVESYYDNHLVALKENIKPYKLKCYKKFLNINELDDELKEIINFTYKEVFNINNMSKFYLKSIKDMRSFYKVFRYDPYGLKIKFYRLVDKVCSSKYKRKVPLSYYNKTDHKFFNLEHNTWYFPSSKRLKSNKSINDIYIDSVYETVKLIKDINNYIYEDKGRLKKILKDVSYVTGRETSKHYQEKYYESI